MIKFYKKIKNALQVDKEVRLVEETSEAFEY